MATISTIIPWVGFSQIFQESVRMIEHGAQCCNNSFLCPVWRVIKLQKRMYLQQVPLIRSRHEGLHALSLYNLHEPAREIRFPLTHRQTLLLLAEGEDRCVFVHVSVWLILDIWFGWWLNLMIFHLFIV